MKRLLLAAAALALAAAGCGGKSDSGYVTATGTIENTTVTISAKSAGEIKEFYAVEGKRVRAGDTLLVIDTVTYYYLWQQAKAARTMAEAQLLLLRNGARKEDIAAADLALVQAEANFNSAKKDLERFTALAREHSITDKQYDDAVTRYTLAQAQLAAAKENAAKLQHFARPEELQQAAARVEQAAAAEALAHKALKDCIVTSPVSGLVNKQYFERGEVVTPQSALLQLTDDAQAELFVYLKAEETGRITAGSRADVATDVMGEQWAAGTIAYISNEAEFTPKNIQTKDERTKLVFAVKIVIPNPGNSIKAGMPADARIAVQ